MNDNKSCERLQKVMSRAGIASRRTAEKDILAGLVKVNEQTAKPGQPVCEGDMLNYKDKSFRATLEPGNSTRVLLYNKPEGELVTQNDPGGRSTIFQNLPGLKQGQWISVGRLDINTTGLLLVTNNGKLANHLMHPSSNIDREYACRVRGEPKPDELELLLRGVELEDGPASFSDIVPGEVQGQNQWFHVAIMEGRNREVRRLWQALGYQVSRLKRVRYGPVFLPKLLRQGHYQELKGKELAILMKDTGFRESQEQQITLQPIRNKPRRKK